MAGKADMVVSITANDMASSALKGLQNNIEQANAKIQTQAKHADVLGKNVDKLGYSWQQVTGGLLVAGAGISAVTGFLKDSITAAAEDQKSVQRLAKTMDNLSLSYANSGAEDFIASLSAQTGELDDNLRPAFENLLRPLGDVAKAQDALQLAMDISAGTGRDLQSVSLALGKGFSGQTTAIGRLGAGIDAATLKSGDMNKIMGELSTKFGGQAAVAAQTYSGELKRISTAAGEASESVGYALLSAVDDLTSSIGGTDGAVGAVTALGDGVAEVITTALDGVDAIKALGGAITNLAGPQVDASTQAKIWDNVLSAAVQTTKNFVGGPLYMLGGAYDALVPKQENMNAEFEGSSAAIAAYDTNLKHGLTALDEWTAAQNEAGKESSALAFATRNLSDEAKKAKGAVEGLKDAFDELNGKTRNSIESESSMRDAIKQMHGALKESNPALNKQRDGFDLSRESGRKAAGAMNDVASAAESAAKSAADEGKWKKAQRLMDDARAALVKQATQWGMSSSAAQAYIDKIAAIPSVVTTQVFLKTVGQYRPMATGGLVQGPGTGTSDSIPAMLSNGEFIVRASTVNKLGAGFLQMLNSGTMPHFAGGGLVWTPAGGGQFIGGTASNVAGGTQQTGAPANSQLIQAIMQASANAAAQINADAAYAAVQAAQVEAANAAADFQAFMDATLAAQAQAEADRQAQDQAIWQMNFDANAKQEEALRQAQADALAAEKDRLAALKALQETAIGAARDALAAAVGIRDDWARSTAANSIAFGSVTGFNSGGTNGSDWASLTLRAPGSAGAGNFGDAGGPTQTITGYMQSRLDRVRLFGSVIQKLTAAGLNMSTLQEIVSAGPDQGTTLGQAILDAGAVSSVNVIQGQLQDTAGAIGAATANTFYGSSVLSAQQNYNNVVGANGGVDTTPLSVNVVMDGNVVVTTLLGIKRARGGGPLGIA